MSETAAVAAPGSSLAAPDRLRVLLVDDSPSILRLLSSFLHVHGHETLCAEDGVEALDLFERSRPDIVLMDVIMPVMDGIEAARRMRSVSANCWVPIIMLSSLDSEDDVIRGLEAGADDYLPKPVNLAVMQAKIRSFQRIVRMQAEIRAQALDLRRLQDEQAYEHELAASLIENIVHREGLRDPALTWHVLPSARFSGDVVAAARAPDGMLYALLGDATGHGLAASVSLIPALQVFYGMARKGLPLPAIVREINVRLREQLPVGRYFASVLVAIDQRERRLHYWNGGMPPGFLVDRAGKVRHQLDSRHVALGILPDAAFESEESILTWNAGEGLIFYSDGLIEATDVHGAQFGIERLKRSLTGRLHSARVEAVMADLHAHLGGLATHDDASILAIDLP
ncbi:MAG: fused response regulator/phosphatase [Burkholderiales bacterium]